MLTFVSKALLTSTQTYLTMAERTEKYFVIA